MAPLTIATEEELARARTDSAFRQQLLSENLKALIDELNRHNQSEGEAPPALRAQLREGAQLAVRLADIITRLEEARAREQRALRRA